MRLIKKFCRLWLTRCSEEGWCNVERPSVEEGAIAGDGTISRDLGESFQRQGTKSAIISMKMSHSKQLI